MPSTGHTKHEGRRSPWTEISVQVLKTTKQCGCPQRAIQNMRAVAAPWTEISVQIHSAPPRPLNTPWAPSIKCGRCIYISSTTLRTHPRLGVELAGRRPQKRRIGGRKRLEKRTYFSESPLDMVTRGFCKGTLALSSFSLRRDLDQIRSTLYYS